jgi:hypothetical protein
MICFPRVLPKPADGEKPNLDKSELSPRQANGAYAESTTKVIKYFTKVIKCLS